MIRFRKDIIIFSFGVVTTLMTVSYLKNRRKNIVTKTLKIESAREKRIRQILETIEDDNFGY